MRLAATGLAGDIGFAPDAIEDVRITVEELCSIIISDSLPANYLAVLFTDGPFGSPSKVPATLPAQSHRLCPGTATCWI